jgi:hypothetical protein
MSMSTSKLWLACLALPLALAACSDDDLTGDDVPPPDSMPPPGGSTIEIQAGDITADTRWEAKNTYVLKGAVFVTAGTLTIEAGTTVKGDNGSSLAVSRGGKINAVGTVDKPIVFTSVKATPASGDWGGVILLGRAPINIAGGTNLIEGYPAALGEKVTYGGTDAAHDCGKLKYVRIEYAGYQFGGNNELNGLTLGGCGTATEIDYIQSHLGLDDGIEIFGGTVNVRHLVITQPDDDGFDTDLGWTGSAQFVIVQQKPGRGDKGFEWDNHPSAFDSLPRNAGQVWNYTLIGGDGASPQGGLHLRRGTAGSLNNGVIAYFSSYPVDIDGITSANSYGAGLAVKHTFIVRAATIASPWPATFESGATQNDPLTAGGFFIEQTAIGQDPTTRLDVDVRLTDPKSLIAPSFAPQAGSPVLGACGTPPAGFDTAATHCGAVGAVDWTVGWTRFPS